MTPGTAAAGLSRKPWYCCCWAVLQSLVLLLPGSLVNPGTGAGGLCRYFLLLVLVGSLLTFREWPGIAAAGLPVNTGTAAAGWLQGEGGAGNHKGGTGSDKGGPGCLPETVPNAGQGSGAREGAGAVPERPPSGGNGPPRRAGPPEE
jgi:hypothetical protein